MGVDVPTFSGIPRGVLADGTYGDGTHVARLVIQNGVVIGITSVSITGGSPAGSFWPIFNVLDQGAVPDGNTTTCLGTDNTAAFNNAIAAAAAAPGGGFVYVPKGAGAYMVDGNFAGGKSIRMVSNVYFILEAGSEIGVIKNALDSYAAFYAVSIDNFGIYGYGSFVTGERGVHLAGTGQYGMGVQIQGCTNGMVDGVKARNFWGDGFYLGSTTGPLVPSVNVSLKNCRATNNRRNGFSIVGSLNGVADNCYAEGTNGILPESGFDIEPNNLGECIDFRLVNSYSYNNNGDGFQLAGNSQGAKIINCVADANKSMGVRINGIESEVIGTTVKNMTLSERGCIDMGANAVRPRVIDCVVKDCTTGQTAIYMHSASIECEVLNCRAKNCNDRGVYSFSPNSVIDGFYGQDLGNNGIELGSSALDSHISNCRLLRPTGRALYLGCRCVVDNVFMLDVGTVAGAYVQVQAAGTGTVARNCYAKKTAVDTSILGFRFDSAPALVRDCVSFNLKQYNIEFVGTEFETRGDANASVQIEQNKLVQVWTAPLTANRTCTIGLTRAYDGGRMIVCRAASATGAFTLIVNGIDTVAIGTSVEYVVIGGALVRIR